MKVQISKKLESIKLKWLSKKKVINEDNIVASALDIALDGAKNSNNKSVLPNQEEYK